MWRAAMSEAGTGPEDSVMVGGSSFDMGMARAAGVTAIGVGWGYQPATHLNADRIATSFKDLTDHVLHLAR